ncbi:MAG: flagellar motor switch protein FliN [Armatimonadetes bacterium]|nr:flagellar motor switch protein FliN [Armatimonadota bacterium]
MPDDTAPENEPGTPQDDDQGLDQSTIDALLRGGEEDEPEAPGQSPLDALLAAGEPDDDEADASDQVAGPLDQAALDALWEQAKAETAAAPETEDGSDNEDLFGPQKKSRWTAAESAQERPAAPPPRLSGSLTTSVGDLDLLADVTVTLSVEIGRTELTIEDLLKLGPGSLVELHKLAGEPVEVFVNDRCIARGEVVVVDDNFGVRITELGR